MSYRDELDAAKARVRQLEKENKELEERAALDPDTLNKVRMTCFVVVAIVFLVAVLTYHVAGREATRAHDEADRLQLQIDGLRAAHEARQREAATLRSEIDGLRALRETLQSQVGEAEERLAGITAGITTAEAHLRTVRAPAVVDRPTRLDEAWLLSRLALCRTGGTAEHPYAEGVVTRIELRQSVGTNFAGSWVVRPSFRATVQVPERGEVPIERRYYSTADGHIMDMLFWSRVEIGDIVGITTHDGDIVSVTLTDK